MTVPILFAGNTRVFDGMVISSLSIVRYCKAPIHVYLLTMDLTDRNPAFQPITEAQRRYLEEIYTAVNADSRVEIVDLEDDYRETMLHSPNAETGYTPYCFLRLYADRLHELPDKVIYLDTDTVLCDDIAKLYAEDVENYELAGVRDRYGCHFFGINYINSGVLLLNLKKIRETGLFRKALDACAQKKIFLPDQTAINRMAKRKRILPRRYNEQKGERDDTVIRHFSMTILWLPRFRTRNIKPWQVDLVHDVLKNHRHDEILDAYLRRRSTFPNT
ncbi:MAG: glycosyltransferase family 8 protein [Clostridia bacterium]|nr:glycosyltransferase family 8 protein [Clostridia bacterium]